MKHARLQTSDRLQRVARLLEGGREYSTSEIVQYANVCAVNSAIAELRANGFDIACRRQGDVWFYRLQTQPTVETSPCKKTES